jgi:hypothetical protein
LPKAFISEPWKITCLFVIKIHECLDYSYWKKVSVLTLVLGEIFWKAFQQCFKIEVLTILRPQKEALQIVGMKTLTVAFPSSPLCPVPAIQKHSLLVKVITASICVNRMTRQRGKCSSSREMWSGLIQRASFCILSVEGV